MKIFTARASKSKMKYFEEQIHFTLDGNPAYNWRNIQKEIKSNTDLKSMPSELVFVTDKVKFDELDTFSWLKSDFKLPILNKEFANSLTNGGNIEHVVYPIVIQNKRSSLKVNTNFVGFYINEYFDCIDSSASPTINSGDNEYFDYRTAVFKADLEYPPLFKIKGISTPFMHFVSEFNKLKFDQMNIKGVDFENVKQDK